MNFSGYLPLLIEILGKGFAVLLLAWPLVASVRRVSAAWRHLFWLASFAVLLALPIPALWRASQATEAVASGPLPGGGETAVFVFRLPAVDARPLAPELAESGAVAKSGWARLRTRVAAWLRQNARALVVGFWLLGVVGLAMLRLTAVLRLRAWRRASGLLINPRLLAVAERVRREAGVGRRVEWRLGAACPVAMTWGTRRPVVLLPEAAGAWSDERLALVLRHELSHVARCDAGARALAWWTCVLHWPNPLVWLTARRLRLEQEQACDDAVLRAGSDATSYAEELLVSARGLATPRLAGAPAVAMAERSNLERRIHAVLGGGRRETVRRRGLVLAACGAVGALAACSSVRVDETAARPPIRQEGVEIREATDAEAATLIGGAGEVAKDRRQVEIEVRYLDLKKVDPATLDATELFGRSLAPGETTSPVVLGHWPTAELNSAVRDLGRRGGYDLLSAPRVTVLNGNRATISVAQELRYPKDFDAPPADPEQVPDAYESRNVGVEAAVQPQVLADGGVGLDMETMVREFEGYIEGPPAGGAVDRKHVPIFLERADTASLVVRPGATVVLRASPRQKVVPEHAPEWARQAAGVGEVPDTSTVLIFVTARVVDPGAIPAHGR